jgi:hypothetical protein
MALLDLGYVNKRHKTVVRDRLMLVAAGLASFGIVGVAALMMGAL